MKKRILAGLAIGLLLVSIAAMANATLITANEPSLASDYNDTVNTAQNVGVISKGGNVIINGWIDSNNGSDIDFYQFSLPESMSLFFDIDYANDVGSPEDYDTGVDTILAIFDSNDMLLAYSNDNDFFDWYDPANDPGSAPAGDLDALIGALNMSAGTYYVAVTSYDREPEAYYYDWFSSSNKLSVSGESFDESYGGSGFVASTDGTSTTGGYQLLISETYDGAKSVPEPSAMLLFGTGLAGLVGIRKKR